MWQYEYDLIIVGGGIAGLALGSTIARQHYRVLILERTEKYQDRIRGEVMMPWGAAAAKDLGLYKLLTSTCAISLKHWNRYQPGGDLLRKREIVESNPHELPVICFPHQEMQQVLADEAVKAGAELVRGAAVEKIVGRTVSYRHGGRSVSATGRLIVGADGRQSKVAADAKLKKEFVTHDVSIAGLMMQGLNVENDASHFIVDSDRGRLVSVFPVAEDKYRVYFAFNDADVDSLSGNQQIEIFKRYCLDCGLPGSWLGAAEAVGPLGTFTASTSWIKETPRAGLTLIGDAAGISDPIWGCGLALALLDVRALSRALMESKDWDHAAIAYFSEHLRHYRTIQSVESWMTDLFLSLSPQAVAARKRAMPILAKERDRSPDLVGLGPDNEADEAARSRFYCED